MKNHWVKFLSVTVLFISQSLFAEPPDLLEPADTQLLKQVGQLFTVEFSPKDRKIFIRSAGKTVGKYSDDQFTVIGQSQFDPDQSVGLHIVRDAHSTPPSFSIVDPIQKATVIRLEVKEKTNGRTEKFNFKLH